MGLEITTIWPKELHCTLEPISGEVILLLQHQSFEIRLDDQVWFPEIIKVSMVSSWFKHTYWNAGFMGAVLYSSAVGFGVLGRSRSLATDHISSAWQLRTRWGWWRELRVLYQSSSSQLCLMPRDRCLSLRRIPTRASCNRSLLGVCDPRLWPRLPWIPSICHRESDFSDSNWAKDSP